MYHPVRPSLRDSSVASAFRRKAAVLTLALLFVPWRAAAADQWIEVKSAHFTVVSNAGDRATRRLVWQLEQVRSATSALFSWAKPDLNKPLAVVVLKDQNSMRALAPKFWEERRAVKPASVWVTGPDQHYLVLRTDVETESQGTSNLTTNPYITAYFSYISLVLNQSLDRDLPLWFTRGFTGVLSNTIVNDDHVLLGAPISWNLQLLRERPIYPLPRLLGFTQTSPETNDATPREVYDAETWAFVHFLMFADGQRTPVSSTSSRSGSAAARTRRRRLPRRSALSRRSTGRSAPTCSGRSTRSAASTSTSASSARSSRCGR